MKTLETKLTTQSFPTEKTADTFIRLFIIVILQLTCTEFAFSQLITNPYGANNSNTFEFNIENSSGFSVDNFKLETEVNIYGNSDTRYNSLPAAPFTDYNEDNKSPWRIAPDDEDEVVVPIQGGLFVMILAIALYTFRIRLKTRKKEEV